MQEVAWMQVVTGWKAARTAAVQHPDEGTTITLTKKQEREGLESDIEFFIVDISNSFKPEDEERQYQGCLVYFQTYGAFKNLAKKIAAEKIGDKSFFAKPLRSKYFNTSILLRNAEKYKEAGEKEFGESSLASMFLKLGIMSHVGKYASIDEAENAFLVMEKEMLEAENGPASTTITS
jgi:phosphorylcholine metabolism protein LicD